MTKVIQILDNILVQIAKEQNFVNYETKVEPISSGGANYTSTLYNVTITEGNKSVHMFAKVAAAGEKMRTDGPNKNFYKTESMFYTNLLKIYEQLQDEHQVPQEYRPRFPKFYGYNSIEYEEIIVLENLITEGYKAYDRFKPVDWEFAKSAIGDLAKLHALGYAYGEYYPEEYNKLIDAHQHYFEKEEGMMAQFYRNLNQRAVDNTRQENREKMRNFIDKFDSKNLPTFFAWRNRPVFGHGDYRPSNLMHKIRQDGSVDIKIVDLQTMQGSSPIVDLLYFIFTGSDEEFRAQYYEKLLDHYYTQLSAAMKRLHLDPEKIYSREDFEQELKEKLPFGLMIAVFTLPVVTVETEHAPEVNEDMDLSSFSVKKTSDLYIKRLNGVVNDYVRWGVLK